MVNIRKVDCPANKISLKCPYSMTPELIVIHNTANDAPAKNEISYMHSNNSNTSFHFAVDDIEIVQGIDLNRNTWNAGDGVNGRGNRKGISIEICYSLSGGTRFETAQKNAAEFTAKLLKDYGWGIEKVMKHQDFNGKYCPHRTLEDYGWDYFLNLVKSYMNTSSETSKKTLYRVQVGAFKSKSNADAYAKKAESAGFKGAFVTQASNGLYKVQVGAFSNKANAEFYVKKAEEAGFKGAFIVEK